MYNPTIFFGGFACEMQLSHYTNGNKAISLVDTRDGSAVATATVNVDGVELSANEVMIKDYSENKGMLAALRDSKVVENIVEVIQSGYVAIPVVTLSANALKAFETIDGFNNLRGVDNHAV
jgi:hypothetical protein